ncbi:MAG: DUF1592 domain-containing protein, partial [Verrucomicrobiota bacterium]
PQPIEPQLTEVTVADGKPKWYTMRVWLEAGQQPRFIFPNGMANCRSAFGAIARRYGDDWPKGDRYHKDPGIVQSRRVVLEHGKMPHIRIHEVGIRGPLFEAWPPKAQQDIFGQSRLQTREGRREVVERFASRAYRRPATGMEIDRLMSVVNTRMEEGRSPRQATKDAIKAALCSPAFLYLSEAGKGTKEQLSAHDLASRLSYFLWGTFPDTQLRTLAEDGSLRTPDVLRSEARRMLADERSREWVTGFLDSWLNLRELGGMAPDRGAFGIYYAKNLEHAMKEEVRHFTQDLLRRDSSVLAYLDSDYSFVNQPLASLYGVPFSGPKAKGHEFQRVSLTRKERGGLLGMAAIHTVSANGIDTSPVTRGVYVLENILGTPPAPPPDEVPAIEPDTRGATTIREELEKHREVQTCAECHRKIDPPGFALENFDPIGRWRTMYPKSRGKTKLPIDSTGVLADGKDFENVVELRRHLHENPDSFLRHLTESLLAYGIGRPIEILDRPKVDAILREAEATDYGLRSLIEAVVISDLFRSR